MSSLARRGLRTTAAVAGLAALGVGLAGPAFAAPDAPTAPGADGTGASSGLPAAQGLLGQLPAAPTSGLPALPSVFQVPKVNTEGTGVPSVTGQESTPVTSEGQSSVGPRGVPDAASALQGMDAPSMLAGTVGQAQQGQVSTGALGT